MHLLIPLILIILVHVLFHLPNPSFFYFLACRENQQSTVTLTNSNGIISPGYFPKNAVCNWILTAPIGSVFRISLNVYVNRQKLPCSGNYVKIYNGSVVGSDVMFEHDCSGKKDFSGYFFSSGRHLLLEVKTGAEEKSTGLILKYETFAKQGKL